MKKSIITLLAAFFMLSVQAQSRTTLRMMSYNVRNAIGLDRATNYQRVANVINNAHPDVVAIQELDSVTARSNRTDVLNELALRTQMYSCFAPAIEYDGGKYGIGLLSKEKPLRFQSLSLPGSEEKRALLIAEFNEYIYCCVHLSLTEEDRMKSIEIIKAEASKAGKPFFIAGDFNASPESECIKEMQKAFQLLSHPKQATFPANQPTDVIDYIMAYKATTKDYIVTSAQVINEPLASDHRPLLTEVRFAEKVGNLFRTKPYLQNPTEGGITVMWQTTVPAHCWVEYGTDQNNLKRARTLVNGQALCNNTIHKVRIPDLQPGQTYYYRVCSQEILLYQAYKKVFGHTAQSEFSHFTLPAANQTDFTAVIFNDLHQQAGTMNALCEQLKGIQYDFAVFNGDCVDDPIDHDQATKYIRILNEAIGSDSIPAFFMRGNHEIRNAYSIGLQNHYDYVGGQTYGAFSWGDTRVVMLDCGEDKPDDHWVYYDLNDFTQLRNDQVTFLKQETASKAFKKSGKRILIHHIPLYGNASEYNPCVELWGGILAKTPFNICLNGHNHQYAYHPKGSLGNHFPVIVGGGPSIDNATVVILEKRAKVLKAKVINAKGEILLEASY